MQSFGNKVAVVTGGASGIGRGIVDRCVDEGMKVIVADIEEDILSRTVKELNSTGARVVGVPTDVSKATHVETLAERALDAFGSVDLLFNNAGVAVGGKIWENTLADWQWVLGVNLWGVIHGVRSFLPKMLAQESDGHIVNTASIAGLIAGPYAGIYKVSKHGVVSLSETLYYELGKMGAKIKVSVLCPGFVNTKVMDSERNRPEDLQNDPMEEREQSRESRVLEQGTRRAIRAGMSPKDVSDKVFHAIREEKLYILTHPEEKRSARARMEDIMQERNPTLA